MYPSNPQAYEKYGPETHPIPVPMPPSTGHPTAPMQNYSAPPYMNVQARHGSGQWSSGLCHCCDDPANCLITSCCPCITFGQIAELVDQGSFSCPASGVVYVLLGVTGLACLYSCFYRSKLRAQHDLEETPCADCLVHFCCEPCALCQEYRELKGRGFDMGIGWQANMDRRNRGVTSPPSIVGGMRR
ncbi:protein PLANT CADMIUM RESISTANCE 3-like [Magnolia sinica]|uniref:protein PLANT CADMIUM RESISTANCE 3-like n=1 Tax=Magnolia sinica TaxID=86752 RepID=UPI0026589934|nr:protein PLANT CADMIUM RESISTANCE 3-like [Magnolia sinica]